MHRNNLTTIYIVRHGETEWNAKSVMQGHGDSPLTSQGISQVQKTASDLKTVHFDAVFSSDLLRAQKTAEIITLERKLAIKTTEAIRERNYGKFENKTFTEYNKTLLLLTKKYKERIDRDKALQKLHGVEPTDQAATRMITFLREIAVVFLGETVLITSHGGIMRYFLIKLGFGTFETLRPGAITNAGYIKLESDGVDFFVKETKGVNKITN